MIHLVLTLECVKYRITERFDRSFWRISERFFTFDKHRDDEHRIIMINRDCYPRESDRFNYFDNIFEKFLIDADDEIEAAEDYDDPAEEPDDAADDPEIALQDRIPLTDFHRVEARGDLPAPRAAQRQSDRGLGGGEQFHVGAGGWIRRRRGDQHLGR